MRTARFLLAAPMALALAAEVAAHAHLDRATPAVGSTVRQAPAELLLRFSEPLEPAFSTVRVVDASGQQVDKGDKQLDSTDRRILKVGLPKLPPGQYKVYWRVISVDTHVTEGDFTFRVVP